MCIRFCNLHACAQRTHTKHTHKLNGFCTTTTTTTVSERHSKSRATHDRVRIRQTFDCRCRRRWDGFFSWASAAACSGALIPQLRAHDGVVFCLCEYMKWMCVCCCCVCYCERLRLYWYMNETNTVSSRQLLYVCMLCACCARSMCVRVLCTCTYYVHMNCKYVCREMRVHAVRIPYKYATHAHMLNDSKS